MWIPSAASRRLMVGFSGRRPSDELKRVLQETGAMSVIVFARNFDSAGEARDLIADIRSLVNWPLVIAIDQEGGAVVRVTKGLSVFPGNMALGACADEHLARDFGRESGRQLAAMGIDINLAPVVDLQTNPANPGIGIRSFGADGRAAERLAREIIRGHRESGVVTCLKHFPGKGAARVDAHLDLPVMNESLEGFEDPHMRVFQRLFSEIEDGAVMTSHIVVKGLDGSAPATFSSLVVQEHLRRSGGFRGVIIADDLEMGAIARYHDVPSAAVYAARAGHDLLPICHDWRRQLAAGRRLNEAAERSELDLGENDAALSRISRLMRRAAEGSHSVRLLVDTAAGDQTAREIAERSVHVFNDSRGLLPIARKQRLTILAARPHAVVGVEEDMARDFRGLIQQIFLAEGFSDVCCIDYSPLLDETTHAALFAEAADAGPLILFTWNARGEPTMAQFLAAAVARFSKRLVVAHLRNPFDQVFVPDDVTSLTAFGYRREQIRALAGVVSGRLIATGRLPAPIR